MRGCRSGSFNVEEAERLGVPPGRARGLLKGGSPVEIREGTVIYPDQASRPRMCLPTCSRGQADAPMLMIRCPRQHSLQPTHPPEGLAAKPFYSKCAHENEHAGVISMATPIRCPCS